MIQLTREQFESYISGKPDRITALVKPVLNHRAELYKRYSRKDDPSQMMHGKGKIQPFEYYIVKMAKGYLAGKEPTYSITNKSKKYIKNYTDKMLEIRRYNDDGATFSDLMHDYLITAAAYLYVYENKDNEIVYTRLDSRQTVAIYDYAVQPQMIGVVQIWYEPVDTIVSGEVLEIITDKERIRWRNGRREVVEQLNWGDVPCAAAEEPDGIAIFEPAISGIETYEQLKTNVASMTEYNDNAKLLLKGYTLNEEYYTVDANGKQVENQARKTEEDRLYKARVLSVSPDGEITWLLKNIDYTGILDIMKEEHDSITMLTGVPNMTDEAFASADNASALGYKLYALNQYSADADRAFRKAYLRLWEIITGRLNLYGASFDWRDIDIKMNRNLPTDRDKSIDRAAKMKNSGLFADETCIAESQIEVDPADEIAKVEAQEEVEYQKMASRGLTEDGNEGLNKPNK